MSRQGIAITQEGIDVGSASDYQKVLDSRWLFMEVGIEIEETITVPDLGTPSVSGFQRVNVARHGRVRGGVNYVPAFHGSYKREVDPTPGSDDEYLYYYQSGLYADSEYIYFLREYISGYSAPAFDLTVRAKVYNVPILEDYLAPIEVAPDSFKQDTGIGVRALDGSDSSVSVTGHSSHGFSIDTRKKILSVHKVMQKEVNYASFDTARVTAIDTATDTLTIGPNPNAQPYPDGHYSGTGWLATGQRLFYSPSDFSTYPSPLTISTPIYVIKINDSSIKLAASEADALNGVAINLTTSGSLPATITRQNADDDWRIPHDNTYPPSYMFCEIQNNRGGPGQSVTGLFHVSTFPLVMADNTYLYFRGVQSTYIGHLSVIVLKDPIEVAR